MKLGPLDSIPKNIITVQITREGIEPIKFKIQPIANFNEFHKLCPEPKPPMKLLPGGVQEPDVEDKEYLKQIKEHAQQRVRYMLIYGLQATEGLVWEKVQLTLPSTWKKYTDELAEFGLGEYEVARLIDSTLEANSLTDSKIKNARETFA